MLKEIFNSVKHNSNIIAFTGSSQILIQVIGFLAGIAIIRLMPAREYALYILANTLLGVISILADGGIATGVLSEGGKVWKNKQKLGEVLNTGLYLRKKFSVFSLTLGLPILIYFLNDHNASWFSVILICTAIVITFYLNLSNRLFEVVSKLHQDIKPLQANRLKVSVIRFACTLILMFLSPVSYLAIAGNSFSLIYGNRNLKKIISPFVDRQAKINKEYQNNILRIVKKNLPNAIYFAFSGQITIWLISLFGNTIETAQIGALSRLSMLLSAPIMIITTLFVPRFSKLLPKRSYLLNSFIKIFIIMSLFVSLLLLIVFFFSNQILWVLGEEYANLNRALFFSFLGGCVNFFIGVLFSLNSSRGWIIKPVILIPLNILIAIVGFFFFNVSSLLGVLYYNVFLLSLRFLINLSFLLIKIYKLK